MNHADWGSRSWRGYVNFHRLSCRMREELSAVYMMEESKDEESGIIMQHHIPWQKLNF